MELTAKEIQRCIDRYQAMVDVQFEMCQNSTDEDSALRHHGMMMFYEGKRDSYVDLYDKLFPEMKGERAYPFDQTDYDNAVNAFKQIDIQGQHTLDELKKRINV